MWDDIDDLHDMEEEFGFFLIGDSVNDLKRSALFGMDDIVTENLKWLMGDDEDEGFDDPVVDQE
jgi:hypothetical protein